jgi:hypothetical protein
MPQGYLIFHLNLAFSSIRTEDRPEVIRKCYWPLLTLSELSGIPVGIELTGWTLQQIAMIDPSWVGQFRKMVEAKQCELIGSGWSQLIGPLVPYEVNCHNQRLGLEAYKEKLGVTPAIALVNEMAFSTGMVDIYADAGYRGIVMDRDNVRLSLGLENEPISATPTHAAGCDDISLPVLWSDSILFQRLQRVVHGDIPVAEYLEYVKKRSLQDQVCLPIYCNDAEIFDYRPGRFTAESRLHSDGEWVRMFNVLQRLHDDLSMEWLSPSQALDRKRSEPAKSAILSSTAYPIPVKKQAKYNVNRWAVTGRDDLWLNTMCHRIHQGLVGRGESSAEAWKNLCELWASDFRTHITDDRWQEALHGIDRMLSQYVGRGSKSMVTAAISGGRLSSPGLHIEKDEEEIFWTIRTRELHLTLNVRRGLAIKELAFRAHDFQPVIGTLPQGYFSSIRLGADFYSGGVLIDMPGKRSRVTDLERVVPHIHHGDNLLQISAAVPMTDGIMNKKILIDLLSEKVVIEYDFNGITRPMGIVRAGILTLLPEAWTYPLWLHCVNGGKKSETFTLDLNADHGEAATTFVSSSASFGATDGHMVIEDAAKRSLSLRWDPSECAVAPMLKHQSINGSHLTRFFFSLCEMDDTFRPDGHLLPFSLEISAGSF